MPLYTEESLDNLRDKIDLVEVLASHIQLKRAGATYKALCPFHEEKTPSFVVQASDSHYHCFGCGAHGDAIAFLMNHEKMSFVDAVDSLAERFGVILEKSTDKGVRRGPDKIALKEALELATRFYHTLLLHTEEGHGALHYLYARGIDLEFIKRFRIGFAPSDRHALHRLAKGEGVKEEILSLAGLLTQHGRDFFSERITFPITDPFGAVIGFSARKIKEETFGGKYINTSETPLFKKSSVLFGLSYSRQKIAKNRKAIIVEGQIDALRLIYEGFDYTVASQGTAFGEGHVKPLIDLGVNQVYLAMDGDDAGSDAAIKVGNLFQKKGIGVSVVALPSKSDPDTYLRSNGKEAFQTLLDTATDYLPFLVETTAKTLDLSKPAQKNELLTKLTAQIRAWDEPVMVHESLRRLSQLTAVPESTLAVGATTSFIKRFEKAGRTTIDADLILETDLLRWLLLRPNPHLQEIAKLNLTSDLFRHPTTRKIFEALPTDLIALGAILETDAEQKLLSQIVGKKINPDKAEEGLTEAVHRILIRKWMEEREAIRLQLQSPGLTDDEMLSLAKSFDEIKKNQPTVTLPS